MRLQPRLHDHYVARTVILTVLATWGVLLGLDVVMAFAGEFGEIGKGSYTINHAIAATGLSIPWRAYNLFPTAAVIGALLGLGQLAATSELTALRALGLSRRRLSISVALPLALLTLLMVANGEALAPWGEERSQALRSTRHQDLVVAQYSGLWAREGGMFLNARPGARFGLAHADLQRPAHPARARRVPAGAAALRVAARSACARDRRLAHAAVVPFLPPVTPCSATR